MTGDSPQGVVVSSLEDDTGAHCVDILRTVDGMFTFIEYARDADDPDAWHPREDAQAPEFATEYAAYVAATKACDWLLD